MDRKEHRRDGAKSGPGHIRGSSRHFLVRAAAAVLILAGIGLVLFAIWDAALAGWGGGEAPFRLLIAVALALFAIAIWMLASTKGRKEQS